MKVKATVSEATAKKLGISTPTPVEVEVNIPATLAEKVKLFGEEVVNAAVEDSLVISVQALARRMMVPAKGKDGKVLRHAHTQAQIQEAVSQWRPDVRSVTRQSAFEKASTSISKLTPEERAALIKQLTAAAGVPPVSQGSKVAAAR